MWQRIYGVSYKNSEDIRCIPSVYNPELVMPPFGKQFLKYAVEKTVENYLRVVTIGRKIYTGKEKKSSVTFLKVNVCKFTRILTFFEM